MTNDATWSQVHETNPNPYHQIIVLSQTMVNSALEDMYFAADSDSPLVKFELELLVGNINAVLDAPRVSLQVTSQELYYFVRFESGTMELRTSQSSKDTSTKTFDVSGWEIAFPVRIKQKIVKPDDTEYPAYATNVGFKNGVFSIAKLFLDASSSAVYSKEKSSFGGLDWKTESKSIQTNFSTLMSSWISDASENQRNLIGYSVLGEDPKQVNTTAPTFVPTSIDYYNYPWIEPGTTEKVNDLDKNALCYLTVSQTIPPDPVGLPYSGVFVEDGGMLCMNSSLFWDWLLSLLRELNQKTELVPLKPQLTPITDNSVWDFRVAPKLTFGSNSKHTSKADRYFDWEKGTSDTITWTWTGDTLTSSDKATNKSSELKLSETSKSSTSLTFDVGGQTIAIKGTIQFTFDAEYAGTSSKSWFTLTSNWNLNFTMQSVNDGGLQITRIPDPPGTGPCKTTHKQGSQNMVWSLPYDDFCNGIDDWVKTYFEQSLGWLTNDLIMALKIQHRLFLPGSGVFLMEKPRFNKRGDLLVKLQYNGAPPPSIETGDQANVARQRYRKDSTTSHFTHPDSSIPDLFRRLPKEFQKLPARQSLTPEECLRKEIPAPSFSTFTV